MVLKVAMCMFDVEKKFKPLIKIVTAYSFFTFYDIKVS